MNSYWSKSILKPLTKSLNLDQMSKETAKTFFETLAKTGAIEVRINSLSKVIATRKGFLREDLENPSTRTGKESFFAVEATFPLKLAKRAEIAELLVQGMLLAKTPIKDAGRIEDNRLIISWKIKIK